MAERFDPGEREAADAATLEHIVTLWAVTGSSGFIGHSLIQSLTADGIEVRGLSRTAGGGDSIRGDIRDPQALGELLAGAEVVVHLAAYVHRSTSTRAAIQECWSVNNDGTAALVESMGRHCPAAFLVFVSSASVYGRSDEAIDEFVEPAPETPYGESKLAAESIVATSGLQATILRPAIVFGQGAPGNVARLVRMLRFRIAIEMNRGLQRKSIVPVENLVAAIRAVVRDQSACAGEVFNVGGAAMTMREITDTLARSLGIRPLHVPISSVVARGVARGADVVGRIFPTSPSLTHLVDAYASSSIIDDRKLRSKTSYVPVVDVRLALERSTP